MPTPAAAAAPAPAATDDASKKADTGADKPAAAAAAGGSLFGNFGAAKPAAIPAATTATSAPAVSSLLVGSAPANAPAPASTASAPKAQEPAPSVVKGKTFSEIVERFEAELEDQVARFKDQAAEVREWDMILIDNSQKVRQKQLAPPWIVS